MTEERSITPKEEGILAAASEVVQTYRTWQASIGGVRKSLMENPNQVEDQVAIGKRTQADFYEAVRALVRLVEGKYD